MNDNTIEFNSQNVFASLALFNQLTVPLFIFPITVPIIISSIISTKRIERFLSQAEIEKEFEGVINMARILSKKRESLDDDQKLNVGSSSRELAHKLFTPDAIDEEEKELNEELLMKIKINDHDVKISENDTNDLVAAGEIERNESSANCSENSNGNRDGDDGDDDVVILRNRNNKIKLKKQNQLCVSARLERNRLRSTTAVDKHGLAVRDAKTKKTSPPFKVADEVVVCIENARFSWGGKNDTSYLEIDHLSIPKGIVFHFFISRRRKKRFSISVPKKG